MESRIAASSPAAGRGKPTGPLATGPAWPELAYEPAAPKSYRPRIGVIGCGGIAEHHLIAYRTAGYDVAALCDLDVTRAKKRGKEFFPEANVTDDYRKLLGRDEIEVVDITTHPRERIAIVEAALRAGKHVLSQKPFVLDLDDGERLADLADAWGVQLAVNQNGRWAPHFSYIHRAIEAGLLGDIASASFSVHWDHQWVAGTPFEDIRHLILYDFAIHWFDILTCFCGPAKRVFASVGRTPDQQVRPPLRAQVIVEYGHIGATMMFDGATPYGPQDRTYVRGTRGTAASVGPDYKAQSVTLTTAAGSISPELRGRWFSDGFRGTMGELLCAIEEGRTSTINARNNLRSLELCFAAVASAESGMPVAPGSVRRMPLTAG